MIYLHSKISLRILECHIIAIKPTAKEDINAGSHFITFYKNITSTKIACLWSLKIKFRSFRSDHTGSRAHHVVIIDSGYVC